jgi:hypothetical protein
MTVDISREYDTPPMIYTLPMTMKEN